MRSKHLRNILFGLLVLGYIFYGIQYIQKTSITVDGQTYYILFDDAMISMRYAYNLAHGQGLVWNTGEYVEGYTNPLWVGYMALFHLFPIPINTIALYIQCSGLLFLTLTLFFVRKVVEEFTDDLFVMIAAVALTAFYGPLNIWGLLGMEVSILTLILTAALWIILHNSPRFTAWTYVLLAVSTLIRIDMAVPYLVILIVLSIAQPQHRRQHIILGLSLLFLFLGGQTLARYVYYGELLPNTYYLKVVGWPIPLRIMRGLYAFIWFAYYMNWTFVILPFTLFVFRRDWKIVLLFAVLAGQVAYSVYVGGDAWETHGGANRYIAIVMPVFFILFAWTIRELLARAVTSLGPRREILAGSRVIYLVIVTLAMLNFNFLLGEWEYVQRWQLRLKPDYVAGNERNLEFAIALKNSTRPGASIAVIGAGTIPYLLPDRFAIDILGKTDPVIAHGPIRQSLGIPDVAFLKLGNENRMRPGHMKWNYAYTIGERKPDVIVTLWDETTEEAAPYLQDYVIAQIGEDVAVFVRKDSDNIIWDKVVVP